MLNKSYLQPGSNSFMYNPNSSLPPIFNPINKKIKKKNSGISPANLGGPYISNHHGQGSHSPVMNITMNVGWSGNNNITVNHFNSTKKNFPTIKKITTSDNNKNKYVSPYSIKNYNLK